VGYITYTEVEDAEKAVAELNNGSFGVSTRKIRVSLADIKVRAILCSYLAVETDDTQR